MSSAGDVNGDGFDDLLIGAYAADASDNAKSTAGESYVIFGGDFTAAVTHEGTATAEALTGDASANVMIGGRGNDTLVGNGGADVLRGGEGSDVLAVSDLSFKRIVGGNGSDTLSLSGDGLSLNLTMLADNMLLGIEVIDLTGSGDNTLTLTQLEVLNLSDESNTLLVRRNFGDTINMGTGWTQEANETIEGIVYRVFNQGTATLKIESINTLSAALAGGDLTITDRNGMNNSLTVSASGSDIVITDANETFDEAPSGGVLSNGNKTLTIPAASITGTLTINSVGGTDTIAISELGTTLISSLVIDAGRNRFRQPQWRCNLYYRQEFERHSRDAQHISERGCRHVGSGDDLNHCGRCHDRCTVDAPISQHCHSCDADSRARHSTGRRRCFGPIADGYRVRSRLCRHNQHRRHEKWSDLVLWQHHS